MGLLKNVKLRQPNIWEPPTIIDMLLASPAQYLILHLYRLVLAIRSSLTRRKPLQQPPIRVVCISDTHDHTDVALPPGELLIHAGDLTNAGTVADIQKQLDWLDAQPHLYKIAIAGNHDSWFDPRSRKAIDDDDDDDDDDGQRLEFKSVKYLQDELVGLKFEGNRTLNVYGSPHIPLCGGSDFAFQYVRDSPPWAHKIPDETDVLVTHSPPAFHRDLGLGCRGLLAELWRCQPTLHVFGHVHWGAGREHVFFDSVQLAYERSMARPKLGIINDLRTLPQWLPDALTILLRGLFVVMLAPVYLFVHMASPSVLVNAAQMRGNTGTMRRRGVEVVEL